MILQRRSPRHHIMISGTGRSGTTALVQLFTYLGVDTGYTRETCWNVNSVARAGLEADVTRPNRPYLIKSPWLADRIDEAFQAGVTFDCAILPIRDLEEVTRSRVRVYEHHRERGNTQAHAAAGSLWKTQDPQSQSAVSAMSMYHLLERLTAHEVPTFLVSFPRFAREPDYLWRALEPVFRGLDITQESVTRAHGEVMFQSPARVRISDHMVPGKNQRLTLK